MSYKIRIYPNRTQEQIINRTMGACRWIYNQYLGYNIEAYSRDKSFISGYDFSKILTQLKKNDKRFMWLNEISSKAIHESFMNADKAFKKFFKNKTGFPRFKSKKYPVQSYYFIGDNVKFKNKKVILPILGKIRITEINYMPRNKRVIGGTICKELNKYYAIFRMDMAKYELMNENVVDIPNYGGYGIDVGIKSYATISDRLDNSYTFKSFLNDTNIIKLEEKVRYFQRLISNKMEINYDKLRDKYLLNHDIKDLTDKTKNIMKGKSYSNTCKCIQKKISRIKKRINNIKVNYINNLVISLTKLKPEYITLETLDIKDMLENDSSTALHRHIQDSKFRYFFDHLIFKCKIYGIEIRRANKYFASSKLCHICGNKKNNLTLSGRVYKCDVCGNVIDRDINASLNLVNLKKYKII